MTLFRPTVFINKTFLLFIVLLTVLIAVRYYRETWTLDSIFEVQ